MNAHLLEAIADATGGRYQFVSRPDELSEVFDSTIRRAQQPVLHNARLKLKLGRGVQLRHAYRLLPSRRDFGAPEAERGYVTLPLGDLHDKETASTLLELQVPSGPAGSAVVGGARVEHDGTDPS